MEPSAATAETSESELARAFAVRAAGAFEEAYRRHAAILRAVAGQILSAGEVEDCVHDTLLRIWMAPDSYRPERGALRAFLIVCVRNEALTRRRAAARHAAIEERVATERAVQSDDELERSDPIERARLDAALRGLPAEQRRVIELAYFGGRTQTEIASALALPLGTVKSRASLALRKLALALAPGAS
jgi:RNA polymerase sigma-70 factor (ECF subfamily)